MKSDTSAPLVDWREPAKFLRLQQRAFWEAVKRDGIPHYRINSRVIRFRMAEIEDWLKARRVGA